MENITDNFKLATAVWNGDKFLIEAATASGEKQIKVTAEVVRAYLGGRAGAEGTDRQVLPFRGIIDSARVLQSSAVSRGFGFDVWFVASEGCFAAVAKTPLETSAKPTTLYSNWDGRNLYEEGFTPRQGNLYVCAADDKPYWWAGTELRPCVTDSSGEIIGESIPNSEIDDIIAAASAQAAQQTAPVAAQDKRRAAAKPTAAAITDLTKRAAVITDGTARTARVITVG